MLGSYGNFPSANIDRSITDGVYVHRIVHRSDGYQGCKGWNQGGVVCSRSCGENTNGLVDATVSNLYIPEIGDLNSVSIPFGIGVHSDQTFCGGSVIDSFPIRNLVFKEFSIYPEPTCKSVFYDDSGHVHWANHKNRHSVTFFDPDKSDKDSCDFKGAVSFGPDPSYFVCGEYQRSCLFVSLISSLTKNGSFVSQDLPTTMMRSLIV